MFVVLVWMFIKNLFIFLVRVLNWYVKYYGVYVYSDKVVCYWWNNFVFGIVISYFNRFKWNN